MHKPTHKMPAAKGKKETIVKKIEREHMKEGKEIKKAEKECYGDKMKKGKK